MAGWTHVVSPLTPTAKLHPVFTCTCDQRLASQAPLRRREGLGRRAPAPVARG